MEMVGGLLVYFWAVALVTGLKKSFVLLQRERGISNLRAKGGVVDGIPGDALNDVLRRRRS